jgi:FKBP-type peptidyl-prolyl cis-trans isomerase
MNAYPFFRLPRLVPLAGLLVTSLALAQEPPALASPQSAPGASAGPLPSPEQMSYLFGLTFGNQLHNVGVTDRVSPEGITRGVADGLKGRQPSALEAQQLQTYLRAVVEAGIAKNQAEAAEFLSRNTKEKGVITTTSGLQFRILSAGDKKAPAVQATDQVTVQYRGKLLDGTEFDSSYARGVPAMFPVNGVIKGWQEALVLMKPGAKWQIWVPPSLGYGSGPRPHIPGGSLLIFEVEMMAAQSVAGAVAPAAPPASGSPAEPPGTPPSRQKH